MTAPTSPPASARSAIYLAMSAATVLAAGYGLIPEARAAEWVHLGVAIFDVAALILAHLHTDKRGGKHAAE